MLKVVAISGLFVLAGFAADHQPSARMPKAGIPESTQQEPPSSSPSKQATPPASPADPHSSTPTCDEACLQGKQNIRIQRWLMYFTGGLVVVGLLQVFSMILQTIVMHNTRLDVTRQANWMETQAGHMASQVELMRKQSTELQSAGETAEKSALAASRSAEAALAQVNALKSRERAKLSFELTPFSPYMYFRSMPALQTVNWLVRLHGQSEAYDVRATAILCIGEPEPLSCLGQYYPVNLPAILMPVTREYSGSVSLQAKKSNGEFVGSDTQQRLENGEENLFFAGAIEYTDVYGDRWIVPIRRRWVYIKPEHRIREIEIMAGSTGGFWLEDGDNRERRKQSSNPDCAS